VIGILISGCAPTTQRSQTPLKVVVTILPYIEFVKAIGGPYVEVDALIPGGANPAFYEPSAKSLKQLANADIYFINGLLPFEDHYLDKIISQNPNLQIVDLSKGVYLAHFESDDDGHSHHGHSEDPHTWLSPLSVGPQIKQITKTLKKKQRPNTNGNLKPIAEPIKID